MDKILVIEIAGLGYDFFLKQNKGDRIGSLKFQSLKSVFPAVTCTVQASFRTGKRPECHGIVGNGFYSREFNRPFFWEQSSSLTEGPKIWERFRRSGKSVGQLFWQQSLGRDSDLILSPAPIHKHHGGMIRDCYARPSDLYQKLKGKMGRAFNLRHYWGPMTSVKSSKWITDATAEVMHSPGPDLLLTYLPHLDYALQKKGPDSEVSAEAFKKIKNMLEKLLQTAEECGYQVIVFGDYAIMPVSRPIFPNRILREKGFLSLRTVNGMTYPDFYQSKAFAVADHQIAHIIIKDKKHYHSVKEIFLNATGVDRILDREEKKEMGIDHRRTGDFILISRPDAWFAYHWWEMRKEAPDYASHVDIHNKPGYDPCELFFDKWPFSVSMDPSRIKGSHGILDPFSAVAWASTLEMDTEPETLVDLSGNLAAILDRRSK